MSDAQRLAILCGGGPAPGINSVIGAATIRANLGGVQVVGLRDGFKWLMQGDTAHTVPLSIDTVSRIHFSGGSYIGTSRANPTRQEEHLERTIGTLEQLGVDKLLTIGGDDTAYSAMTLAKRASGRLRVVHVPKTIDNDLDLPHGISTFGFQTARHVGTELVKNLMTDARTTTRWYLIVAMGRTAGHLALGIGKAAGATLSIIPEEFGPEPIRLGQLVDVLAGAVVKRRSHGHEHGTAMLAEGLIEHLAPEDLQSLGTIERDEHGHPRLSELNLGDILKERLQARLKALGISATLVSKEIGYELRCADPIPLDMEYTRDLGYCGAEFLLEGGSDAMVTLVNGRFEPLPFAQMLDPRTGRTRVRLVDIDAEHYRIARQYMVRLNRSDFADRTILAALATAAGLATDEFRAEFGHVIEHEHPPTRLRAVS